MATESRWMPDEHKVRLGFACAATLAGLSAIYTRNEPAVDWSILGPTVATWWLWALSRGRIPWPMYFMSLTAPFVVNIVESDAEISMFVVVLAVAAIASFENNRVLAATLAIFAGVATIVLGLTAIESYGVPNWLFGIALGWLGGQMAWRYSHIVDELHESRALVADHAAINERRRIARDVHDLVGHSLTVVMLHVTGARHLIRSNPDEAERALDQAEQAGRRSLAEIRRTVAMLRDEHDPHESLPAPDLGDIAALVDDFFLAGLNVICETTGPIERIDPTVALAGYRIVQEALTNASRHTIGAEVQVTVNADDSECLLAVANRGGENLEGSEGSGFGLVSMRERARSVGGSLVAAPAPQGWLVEAILPAVPVGALP